MFPKSSLSQVNNYHQGDDIPKIMGENGPDKSSLHSVLSQGARGFKLLLAQQLIARRGPLKT